MEALDSSETLKSDVKKKILGLPYFSSLRPSTLLGYLISCAPPQLPLPFEAPGWSLQSYFDELNKIPEFGGFPAHGSQSPTIRSLYAENWNSRRAEMACWDAIQASLDIFVQRLSVTEISQRSQMRTWYDSLLEIGEVCYRNEMN